MGEESLMGRLGSHAPDTPAKGIAVGIEEKRLAYQRTNQAANAQSEGAQILALEKMSLARPG